MISSNIILPGYVSLIKIIFVLISSSHLLSCSAAFTARHHDGRLNQSRSRENHSRSTFYDKATHSQEDSDVNGSSNTDKLNKRHLYFLMAQQEARCLHEFGKLKPTVSVDFPQDLFRPFVCVEGSQHFNACDQCLQMIWEVDVGYKVYHEASCQNICRILFALPNCTERCTEWTWSLTNGTEKVRHGALAGNGEQQVPSPEVSRGESTTGAMDRYSNATLTTTVFCESVEQSTSRQTTKRPVPAESLQCHTKVAKSGHFVCLKSYFSGGGDGDLANGDVPVVFVIEQRRLIYNASRTRRDRGGEWTSWSALGKSPHGFEKIPVAYQQQTYQWRVTAVGIHGPLAVSIVHSFETLDGYIKPGPPERVFVIENKPKESTVDVLSGWDPPKERACFYKIVVETRNDEETTRTLRIKGEPLGVHKVWFRDLRFDSTCEVRITSRNAYWHEYESPQASLSFTTPACLDAHQFRFDKCAPPPPQNLSFSVKAAGSSRVQDVSGNPTTSPKRSFTASLMWKPPAQSTATNMIEKYVVDIRAFSWNGGRSSKLSSKYADGNSELIDPQYPLIPRRLYLPGNMTHLTVENLDETAEYTVLVSAVSSKGSSPAATMIIKLDSEVGSLKIAVSFWLFPWGILLAALVIASCCLALKRISRRRLIKAARDSYFKAMDQRDAFAVDWLMDSLTEDANSTWKVLEENSFIRDKWFVDIQDLTIGDILGRGAFGIVRKAKIRQGKYLELLKRHNGANMDAQFTISGTKFADDETGMETVALKMLRGVWCENPGYKRHSCEDRFKNKNYSATGDQFERVCQIELHHTEMSSSRRELSDAAKQEQETETDAFSCNNDAVEIKEGESISAKCALSYARQIALDMAYLERNHIIHRDLACRNILVMGDHKQIKISDFGLSRDVYTWNVYEQKKAGKLPFKWMALESITSGVFTSKSDVWSYGIVMWELVTLGAVPYPTMENQELLKVLCTGNRMERPDNCSEELYALMQKCWRRAPVDGPTFTELISYLDPMLQTEPELYLTLQP